MQLEYTKYGDYLLPNLMIKEQRKVNIGKYGLIVLNHIKTNKQTLYQSLLMQSKLTDYLIEMDKDIKNKVDNLINVLTEKENINEVLKEKGQLQWVGFMNFLRNTAEEIVLSEYLI